MPNRSDKFATGDSDPPDRLQVRAGVRIMLARFPHVQSVSLELLERQEEFREICEEYEACVVVLERLSQTRADRDGPMYREYSALCLRLEGELLRYLSMDASQTMHRSSAAKPSSRTWPRNGDE